MSDRIEIPASSDVLSQGSDFRPEWWTKRVPADWSDFLPGLPAAPEDGGYHRITRSDLFKLAVDTSDAGCARLLLGCYVWGTGKSAFLVGRRARTFTKTEHTELVRRLADARHRLSTDGPEAAYGALQDHETCRIKFLGPSFFTKFLYFADGTADAGPGRALILDQFVALALNDLHGWRLPRYGPWTAGQYRAWLEFATSQAAASEHGNARLDAIELAYFRHGRTLASTKRKPGQPAL